MTDLRRRPSTTAKVPVIVVGWTSQTEEVARRRRAPRRHRVSGPGPARRSPVSSASAPSIREQIAKLCGMPASWLSKLMVNASSAGATRQSCPKRPARDHVEQRSRRRRRTLPPPSTGGRDDRPGRSSGSGARPGARRGRPERRTAGSALSASYQAMNTAPSADHRQRRATALPSVSAVSIGVNDAVVARGQRPTPSASSHATHQAALSSTATLVDRREVPDRSGRSGSASAIFVVDQSRRSARRVARRPSSS